MNRIISYFKQDLDIDVVINEWNAKDYLNPYLVGNYEFYCVKLLKVEFVLAKPYEIQDIQRIKKQIDLIKNRTDMEVAILLEEVSSYRLKKLLHYHIPFISQDKQLFLPFIALHVRKTNTEKNEKAKLSKFSASSQLIYLYMLYQQKDSFTVDELVTNLELSAMSVSRTMQELSQINIIHHDIGGLTGRKKHYTCSDKKSYYIIGKEYLQCPIQKTIYVKMIPNSVKAYKNGLFGLSEQSMLGYSGLDTYAVDKKNASFLNEYKISKLQAIEENGIEVHLMKYDIALLTDNNFVDPITLIQSLSDMDERIEMAIDEMMGGIEWFED